MSFVYYVYLLTFKNNKVYVGMSKTVANGSYDGRYRGHAYAARSGKDYLVSRAWRKHGAPEQSILSKHATREKCCEAEIIAIEKYDSTNRKNGYNVCAGGQGQDSATNPVMHALMREKVWDNPEWRSKVSASLKGRKPSKETTDGYLAFCKTPAKSECAKVPWTKPGYREIKSLITKNQMLNGGSEHLRNIFTGRKDVRSAEGKEAHRQKVTAYFSTDEGKETCRKGYRAFASNPENLAAAKAGQDKWRASERNKIQCQEMAKKAAEKCSKKVIDDNTGIIYESQRAMGAALGLSDAAISRRVKAGKVRRC